MMEDNNSADNSTSDDDTGNNVAIAGRRRKNNVGDGPGVVAQEGDLEGGRPRRRRRVVIDLPEWMPELPTDVKRGIRMLLMAVAITAVAVGSLVASHSVLSSYFSSSSSSVSEGTNVVTVVSPDAVARSKVEDAVAHSEIKPNTYGQAPPEGIEMPPETSRFADTTTPFDPVKDLPLWLHVPRSGGTTVMGIMGKCMGLVQVTQSGSSLKKDQRHVEATSTSLPLTKTKIGQVLNMDTYSSDGLVAARDAHILNDERIDVLDTPLPYDAARILFRSDDSGEVKTKTKLRPFVLIRHPVERVISYFYHVQPTLPPMTKLQDYAAWPSERPEFNYLTKILSGKPLGTPSHEITVEDVDRAKTLLKNKFLIGLTSRKRESVERASRFFGWRVVYETAMCHDELEQWYDSSDNDVPEIGAYDPRWAAVLKRNLHDMDLYEYARTLFEEQERTVSS